MVKIKDFSKTGSGHVAAPSQFFMLPTAMVTGVGESRILPDVSNTLFWISNSRIQLPYSWDSRQLIVARTKSTLEIYIPPITFISCTRFAVIIKAQQL